MNRRGKTEKLSAAKTKPKKQPCRTVKKAAVITKRPARKQLPRSGNTRDSSSDEEFQLKLAIKMSRHIQTGTTKKRIQPRRLSERIYQISDSSDDEVIDFKRNTLPVIAKIDLCDTENDTDISALNDIGMPSTSKANTSLSTVKDNKIAEFIDNLLTKETFKEDIKSVKGPSNTNENISEFINDLLDKNKDNFDQNILASVKELNDQTDELLETSWSLINEVSSATSFEDSVIYVPTNQNQINPVTTKGTSRNQIPPAHVKTKSAQVNTIAPAISHESTQKRLMSTQCPICLENLSEKPVSATVCGHTFCTPCIQNCITQQKKCPTCRKSLTLKKIHPLFLF